MREHQEMEDSGRVDDEGRPILEKVDLMEMLFTVRPKSRTSWWFRCGGSEMCRVGTGISLYLV